LQAIENYGWNLYNFISEELKSDYDISEKAIENDKRNNDMLDSLNKTESEIILRLRKDDKLSLVYAQDYHLNDKE